MSKGDNSPGLSRLAGVMRDLAKKDKDTALVLDFGTIQGDGSLLTNTYPLPIPKSDYIVCRHLKSWEITKSTNSRSVGDHGEHSHSFTIERRERLKKGDRVVAEVIARTGETLDYIYNVPQD